MVSIRQHLQASFQKERLSFLGIVTLGPEPAFDRFEEWLAEGRHADMDFLNKNKLLRKDPRGLLENAQQALIFGMPYWQGDRLHSILQGSNQIAQYARLRDYHKVMKQKAERILGDLQARRPEIQGRVTIDSAPLLERALASRTAAGFIGKNTCFIHPKDGSFFLLGEILLDQIVAEADEANPVEPSQRSANGGCGSCKRCQVYCPTGALNTAYKLDARRCLAYWTIEHRGTIPEEFWPWLKTYLFGCDLCQLACPYNRNAQETQEPRRFSRQDIDPFVIACMDQKTYEELFGGTPLTRAKRSGLRRNALIAMTVSDDPRLDLALAAIGQDDADVLKQTAAQIDQWRKNSPAMHIILNTEKISKKHQNLDFSV